MKTFFFIILPVQKYRDLYCYHFDVGMGVGVGFTLLSFMSKFFMLWAGHCQASYSGWGWVLFFKNLEVRTCSITAL